MPINILSVDWDYFFPNPANYDWGHSESRAIFFEVLWPLRLTHRNLITKARAWDEFIPRAGEIKTFWNNVVTSRVSVLTIAETHADILKIIGSLQSAVLYSFDQHHDLGYGYTDSADCSNWAYHALKNKYIAQYNLVYPAWRKKDNEGLKKRKGINIHYKIPALPQFNIVFICRSGAWTPTWFDKEWIEFISFWKRHPAWKTKFQSEYAMKKRSPNMQEAEKLYAQFIEQEKYLYERMVNHA